MNKLTLAVSILLLSASPVFAGCSEFSDNSSLGPAPQALLCYRGRCDTTTVTTVCSNAFRTSVQYANGLIVYIPEKNPTASEFSNNLGKKMKAKDWTCKAISTGKGITDPCLGFHSEPGEE